MATKLFRSFFLLYILSYNVGNAQHSMEPNHNKKKVAALLYNHVVPIDYVPAMGIFMASGQMTDFEVFTIGETDTILSMGGERILTTYTLSNAPKPEKIIVPLSCRSRMY